MIEFFDQFIIGFVEIFRAFHRIFCNMVPIIIHTALIGLSLTALMLIHVLELIELLLFHVADVIVLHGAAGASVAAHDARAVG